MANYFKKILRLRPAAKVAVVGGDEYQNIDWGSEVPIPQATLDAMPDEDVGEAKAEKLRQLERARQHAIATLPPVTVANKQYPATPEYREIVTGIARRQAAGRPIPATLRGLDGAPASLNAALIAQIDDAITSAVQAAWDRYWARFDSVQSATTVEQVNAVEW